MSEITFKAHHSMMLLRVEASGKRQIRNTSLFSCIIFIRNPCDCCRIIKLLCDSGADVTLPDVEGNRAIDVAKKYKNSKCVNYLEQVMKRPPRVNGSVMVGTEYRKSSM